MGLYRTSDVRAYAMLSTLANILVVVACFMVAIYHFYEPRVIYRDTALLACLLSIVMRFQLSMQKVEILEKRVANILNTELPGGKLAASSANLTMIFYLCLFWISVLLVIVAFVPKTFKISQYFF